MRLLPAADRTWVPWRNGGGVTSDVASGPDGDVAFGWRVSIARIERDGPFSAFAGIDRTLVLLEGGPLTLIGPGWRHSLTTGGQLAFDGAEPVSAIIAAPSIDLNVMTRRGAWTHALGEPGDVTLMLATAPAHLAGIDLARFDALLFNARDQLPSGVVQGVLTIGLTPRR
jgi:uncharacterized protein